MPPSVSHTASSKVGTTPAPDVASWHTKQIVSAQDMSAHFGVTVGTIWHWNRTLPDFPNPMHLSPRCTRWDRKAIDIWAASRQAA